MKKIKILPDFRFNEDARNSVPQEILNAERFHDYWYLHGHLEDEIGYDIATMYDVPAELLKETADYSSYGYGNDKMATGKLRSENPVFRPHLNGVYECEVYGVSTPCVGYFWTTDEMDVLFDKKVIKPVWRQRGLVVFSNDGDANAYARAMMSEKSDNL